MSPLPLPLPLPPPSPSIIIPAGGHPKKAFLLGILAVFLLLGLGAGVFLVQRQQDIRSKAATSCDWRWPVDPATTCGGKLIPTNNATEVSSSPNFHWEYEGCIDPTGCNLYAASIFIYDFHPTSSSDKPFARCDIPNQSTPVKDAPFSCFKKCDYGNLFPNDPNTCHTDSQPTAGPLKSGTDYWWTVTPYLSGAVHAEQKYNYHFKTSLTTASCQMVSADKDLTKIQIGDTVKFTGYGSVSSDADKIDKISFILTKDGTPGPETILDAVRATDKDSSGSKFYVATQSAKIDSSGSYSMSIKTHWLKSDGSSEWKQ